jgi:hypothetical protein
MTPTRKVSAGAGASALAIIVVWALNKYAHAEITAEIAGAFQGLFAFLVSWAIPDRIEE